MKRLLPIHFILFLLTWLFTLNAFSQALPDPGSDPIEPVDSITQTHSLQRGVPEDKAAIKYAISKDPTTPLEDTTKYYRNYKEEDKVNRSFK